MYMYIWQMTSACSYVIAPLRKFPNLLLDLVTPFGWHSFALGLCKTVDKNVDVIQYGHTATYMYMV